MRRIRKQRPRYTVLLHTEHSTDELSGYWTSYGAAEEAGANWKAEMVANDPDPEEAEEVYQFEVVEIEHPEL